VQPEDSADRVSKLVITASRLALDAGTVEVLRGFERVGVETLLLKGPSIAHWLYTEGEPRTYIDCDLLTAPSSVAIADEVLASLGFTRQFDDRNMPAWWREHATAWERDVDGLTVDLHRTLPGIGVSDDETWRALSAETDVVVVGGHSAPTLALPARALHIALHAAQHGPGWARPIADLERALAAGDADLWLEAAALAAKLDAGDAFAAGLGLVPGGAELAERMRLPPVRSVDAELRAASPPPLALGFEQLARADGMRARAAIVGRKVVPPVDYVRHWDPAAGDSRVGLLRAYVRRPLWIMRRVPRGLEAWWRARRSANAREDRR